MQRRRLIIAVLLVAAFAVPLYTTYSWGLTNDSTPTGDGRRTFLYMEFVDNSGLWYPLWNPYRLGGFATLSDPDRYTFASWFVDTASPYANLQFNALLALIATINVAVVFALARRLALEVPGAIVAALLLGCSQVLKAHVDNGRVNSMLAVLMMSLVLWLYLTFLDTGRTWAWASAAGVLGVLLATIGYYALASILPMMVAVAYAHRASNQQRPPHTNVVIAGMEIGVLAIVGVGAAAVLIWPLIGYSLAANIEGLPRALLGETLPDPRSIGNLFMGANRDSASLRNGQVFPFVSVLAPALAAAALWPPGRSRNRGAAMFAGMATIAICVLLGRLTPFSLITTAIERTPLILQIRQSIIFHYVLLVALALLVGMGVDRLPDLVEGGRRRVLVGIAGTCVLLAAAQWYVFGFGGFDLTRGVDTFPLLAGVAIASSFAVALYVVPARALPALVAGLIVAQFAVLPLFSTMGRTSNRSPFPQIAERLRQDESYFRIYDHTDAAARLNELPTVASVNGFSLVFSPQHRAQIERLAGRPTDAMRPHWAGAGLPGRWTPSALDDLNVKYVVTERPDQFAETAWRTVQQDGSYYLLERAQWTEGLLLRDDWVVESDAREAVRILSEGQVSARAVVLDREPSGIERDRPPLLGGARVTALEAHRVEVEVESNKAAILMLPEYYDPGWTATIDGQAAPISVANASFRALTVPEGSHRVVFHYAPRVVRVSLMVTVFTIACLLGLAVMRPRIVDKSR